MKPLLALSMLLVTLIPNDSAPGWAWLAWLGLWLAVGVGFTLKEVTR